MSAGVPAAAATSVVRWGAGPHVFELRSSLAGVIERAATVFRPWAVESTAPPTRQWTIAPEADARESHQWTLTADGSSLGRMSSRPDAAVRRVEYLAVQAIFDGPPDLVTMHAALVAREGQGVLIAGVPETGKSTLACALWQRGFTLLGDDVAVVDLERRTAAPAPRRVSLRAPSRQLLGDTLWSRIEAAPSSEPTDEGWVFHPSEIDGTAPAEVPIAGLIFLGRTSPDLEPGRVRRVPPAHAALAAVPYLNIARRLDVGTLVPRLTPFVTAVPACHLVRADLATMCADVEQFMLHAAERRVRPALSTS